MKPIIILFVLTVLVVPFASARVVISEILYNPLGSEYELEFVELYNTGNTTVQLSDWYLNTSSSERDVVIPDNAYIKPQHYYLIADKGFNQAKPDQWLLADYEEDMSLVNSNSGVRLTKPDGVAEFIVGWGDDCPLGYYESEPVELGAEGLSLNIMNNTTNGNYNFFYSEPSPTNSATESSANQMIKLVLSVAGPELSISNLYIEDELPSLPGLQVFPEPGNVRDLPVIILFNKSLIGLPFNISVELGNLTKNYDTVLNSTELNVTIPLPYYFSPGNHTVTADVCCLAQCASAAISVQVMEVKGFALDVSELKLSSIEGYSFQIIGDSNLSTLDKPTISNIGNIGLLVEISSSGLALGNNTIPAEAIAVAVSEGVPERFYELSTEYISQEIPVRANRRLSFYMNFEANLLPGDYSGYIRLSAI